MHGHDVGVWVCEGSGLELSPVLFMQALCPDPAPRPLLVKWKPATLPPKAFRKDQALPLIYSECGRLPNWPYHLHLFSPQAPNAGAAIQQSDLPDWSWAVPVIGIILIYSRKYDQSPNTFSFHRRPQRTPLAWAQAQELPYVIAALGYDTDAEALADFRHRYTLTPDIPVIPAPALSDVRKHQSDDSGGMFSSLFEHQKITFDQDYARRILDVLFQQVEQSRTANV